MRDVEERYRCPACGAAIIWAHNNSRRGSVSEIKCANNMTSSRVDWDPKIAYICEWKGVAVRRRNGQVELYYMDAQRRLRPFKNRGKE